MAVGHAPHINRDGSRSSGIGAGGHARDFWAKVRKLDGDDACWEWLGYLDKDGYGKLCTFVDGRAASFRAHRYAYAQEHGTAPPLLMHVCDNRKCVRPSHLRPGTQADNIADMIAKGRKGEAPDNRGELSGRAILTEEAVHAIRGYRGIYGAIPLLATLYNASRSAICGAMYGRSWRHLLGRHEVPMPLALLRELVRQRAANSDRPRQVALALSEEKEPAA